MVVQGVKLARPSVDVQRFKGSMRAFAGSVCVVTVDTPEGRGGLTVTSVMALSVDPPTLLFCVNRRSASAPALRLGRTVGVSLLASDSEAVARRFTGMDGHQGEQRYGADDWLSCGHHGTPVLASACVGMVCEIEEVIERHTHLLVLAAVCELAPPPVPEPAPLVYWQGRYARPVTLGQGAEPHPSVPLR